jgi:hypothetical protein
MAAAIIHGRPCKHGHGTLRYISKRKRCVECVRLDNLCRKDSINKAQRAWYKANRKEHKAKNRRWHAANREKVAARNTKRLADPVVRARMQKVSCEWYLANRKKNNARGLKWCRDNPAKAAAKAALRRASKLQATPKWLTRGHKIAIMGFYRRAKELGLTVDHIVPLKGETVCGLHVPWNLQLLTLSENSSKSNSLGG